MGNKNCEQCTSIILLPRKHQRFCSKTCKNKAYMNEHYEERKKYKSNWFNERYRDLRSDGMNRSEIKQSVKRTRECLYCGKVTVKLYCSDICRKKFEATITVRFEANHE